jgi:hypothetical protein
VKNTTIYEYNEQTPPIMNIINKYNPSAMGQFVLSCKCWSVCLVTHNIIVTISAIFIFATLPDSIILSYLIYQVSTSHAVHQNYAVVGQALSTSSLFFVFFFLITVVLASGSVLMDKL